MTRINAISPNEAGGRVAGLFKKVQGKLGMIPNLRRRLAHSPAALEGYLQFSDALAGGMLPAKTREQIAVTVAESNRCEYCLSAHSTLCKLAGGTDSEVAASQRGTSSDP
jgi:AhpD family alkylhydroperoxidase